MWFLKATDVKNIASLQNQISHQPQKLILNMDDLVL
jgi:predicted AAA+ superfamily ATPase